MLPFRLDAAAEEFAAVRGLFARSGYTTAAVCERGGVPEIYQFLTAGEGRQTGLEIRDALDLLVRLFLDGLPVPATAAHALLGAEGVAALQALGLLDAHPEEPDRYAATVLVYPTEGLYVASDLESHAPGRARPEELERPDHVFSAITTLTGTFLSQLPQTPCGRFLELCAGTGIAALAAARRAGHAWALDITERSTRFAEFNARLNGIETLTALRGDLYEPVAGMVFDRIAAHPPYVPASDTEMIYRDGGEDGEEVIRRILRGLPDHLAPGGHFYMTCVASDRRGEPLEQRIRGMIGEREAEFDLLLVSHYALPPAEYYGRLAMSGRISFAVAEQRHLLFRELGAERIVYCSAVLQRHAAARAPFTLRRERTEGSGWRETEWLLRWSTRQAEEDVLAELLDSRPRLSSHARLRVTHRVEGGEWKVDRSQVVLEYPFVRTVELSLNAAMLLALCDGEQSVREILRRIQGAGAVPAGVPEASFAEFVRELVTEGVLEVQELPDARVGAPASPE